MIKPIRYDIKPMNYAPDENPMGLEGFAFIEFSSTDAKKLNQQFNSLSFTATQKHRNLDITRWQQNDIQCFLNFTENSHARKFCDQHGAAATAMGFKVKDAQFAYNRAVELGAKAYTATDDQDCLDLPAIYGIGGSVIYFVDKQNEAQMLSLFQDLHETAPDLTGSGLEIIDHLTHNVCQGNMDPWADFYKNLFNFRQIRFFDIQGKKTGLISRAMSSPCDKIKIPLNESKDDKSQIEEFLHEFKGEGIQHIAFSTSHIFDTVEELQTKSVNFLDTPDTYYEMINKRIPGHHENVERMRKNGILIDGNPETGEGILLQIFTENMLGPVFFEIIQRKENQGFGEGNFSALFEAIELDQIRRGTL